MKKIAVATLTLLTIASCDRQVQSCIERVLDPNWLTEQTSCTHPDHHIEVVEGVAVCRCRSKMAMERR